MMADENSTGAEAGEEMGPGWREAVWTVEVVFGAPLVEDSVVAPVRIADTATLILGDDGLADPFHAIVYGPVVLRGGVDELRIQVPVEMNRNEYQKQMEERGQVQIGFNTVRMMHRPVFEFGWGMIDVRGAEIGEDRLLRHAVWHISPYAPPSNDD